MLARHSIRPACALWRSMALSMPTRLSQRLIRTRTYRTLLKDGPLPRHMTTTPMAAASQVESAEADAAQQASSGLQLYNTMTRQKEAFVPRTDQGNKVSMYVCGVTVYDLSHIGHARVYVAFDVLYRYLQQLGYDVTYIRNFTDVDDKIINRAADVGEDPLALAKRFITEFHTDMAALGCLRPTLEPLATDYIPAMVTQIQQIMDNGHAYAVDGDVYFDVGSLPGYGKLSGRNQEDNRAGERVAVDDRKRGPADFALWKAAKPGEPTWDSPWGSGRPGWHIECSTMIHEIMGDVIDIHGGGRDLVFPHHENELAQSRAAMGSCSCGHDHGHEHASSSGSTTTSEGGKEDFVRYWVHNGFVNVDAEKMSKSLGNFFTIRDVLQQYHAMTLRWFLVGTQYRQPINYTQRALEEASDRVYYLLQTLADALTALQDAPEGQDAMVASANADISDNKGPGAEIVAQVVTALGDDLNTPVAIAALSGPLKDMNDLLHTKKGKKQADRIPKLSSYVASIRRVLTMLGLWADSPQEVLSELRQLALVRAGLTEAEVAAAIEERTAARAAKDYAAADAVRERLEKVGIAFMDTPQGTTWKPSLRVEAEEE